MKEIYTYLENEKLLTTNSKIEIINEPFDFHKFGKKEFSKIILNNSKETETIIVKTYKDIDLPMLINGDNDYNELSFAHSKLLPLVKEYFIIPIRSTDKKNLYLNDVSAELKRFGPPKMPTEEQFKILITALGKKDALLKNKKLHSSPDFYQRFTLLADLFNGNLSEKTSIKFRSEWSWFLPAFELFKKEIGNAKLKRLVEIYENLASGTFYTDLPLSWQHGDFFFNNIGFTEDSKPVVIDWESITHGPVLFDFASLTDGLPPLPFIKNLKQWYLDSYNNYTSVKLKNENFDTILVKVKTLLFFHAGFIDALRLIYAESSPLPEEHKTAFREEFLTSLDFQLTMEEK